MNDIIENVIDHTLSGVDLEPKLIDEILQIGRLKKVHSGQVVISPGSSSNEMPIVLEGLLKVMRDDDNGNEILKLSLKRIPYSG